MLVYLRFFTCVYSIKDVLFNMKNWNTLKLIIGADTVDVLYLIWIRVRCAVRRDPARALLGDFHSSPLQLLSARVTLLTIALTTNMKYILSY